MANKLGNITFDCADPQKLSFFWADVFGYPHGVWTDAEKADLLAQGMTEEELALKGVAEDPEGLGPRLFFQKVPEGKTAKNRMHIDLRTKVGGRATDEEFRAERDRIIALGATLVVEFNGMWGPFPEQHLVMQDPEGNEFCLQQ
jgi:Glyoxalase-like domain